MTNEFVPDPCSQLGKFLSSHFEEPPGTEARDIQLYKYTRPILRPGKKRAGVRLVNTDILVAFMQVFEHGGENVMHSHAGMDGFWMVIKGRARFHTVGDKSYEVGPLEGVCTPRGFKYWFESIGTEPLEILQVDAIHPNIKNTFHSEPGTEDHMQSETNALALFDGQQTVES
jgi:mannose-6-phosphate isomerase-like protein (cupin superfamily)